MPSIGMRDPLVILGSAPWPDEPWWRRMAPSTLFVLLSAAIAVFFLLHELVIAGKLGFPDAESWVRQVFARNFFPRLIFEYPGAQSTGPTSPFWIVILSLAANVFHDGILAAKLLGAIFLFLTGYYSFRLMRAIEMDYATALLGGILIVTSALLGWSELSGLESTLSTSILLGAFWWHFARPEHESRGVQALMTGAIFALAALTRPEITLVFLIVLVWQIFFCSKGIHRAAFMALAFIVILTPVAITNFAISGSIVPVAFRNVIGNESFVRLLWYGKTAEAAARTLASFGGLWRMIRTVYVQENPVFLITIVLAIAARLRRALPRRDRADEVFALLVTVLVAFPYGRALVLGTPDAFGVQSRLVHFIVPIYSLAGILSVRTLVRYELFRTIKIKSLVASTAGSLLIAGCGCLWLDAGEHPFTMFSPELSSGLLLFFTALLFLVGLRHVGIPIFKREQPQHVTEEERKRMELSLHEEPDDDPNLPLSASRALHAALLVMLAWNLASLPRAANEFAVQVRQTNIARAVNTAPMP